MINFLSNSIKFSNKDSKILVHLQILSEHETMYHNPQILQSLDIEQSCNSYLEFQLDIQDFGCGIPEDKIDHLFINFGNLSDNQEKNP